MRIPHSAIAATIVIQLAFTTSLQAAPPDKAAVDTLISKSKAAEKAATAATPRSKRKKQYEDLLDQKVRELEEAKKQADKVNNDPKSTPEQKKKAKDAQDSKQVEHDAAKNVADMTKPLLDNTYRDALTAKREARKALEKAQKELEEATGKDARDLRKRVRKELERTAPKSNNRPFGGFSSLNSLINSGAVAMKLSGTGQTIGDIAEVTLTNQTDEPITAAIPPMVLISRSGENQHYAVPRGQTVTLAPNSETMVPVTGMCIARSKPAVAEGESGDLYAMDPEGNPLVTKPPAEETPEKPAFSPEEIGIILRTARGIQQATQELQEQGAFEKIPFKDPDKKIETVEQWLTWSDPALSEITGETPASKEDLEETVKKQIPEDANLNSEQEKQLDSGIDNIWSAIELTGNKAKSIEKIAETFESIDPNAKPKN